MKLAFALAAFIALVWLNQGPSLQRWTAERPSNPFAFLYRRAPDEEMYFATASATLGRPYDPNVFGIRGATPLPSVDVPADGRFHMPYAEVPFEYPPPNVPFVIAPRLVAGTFEGYARVFGALMGLLLLASAWVAARLGPEEERRSRIVAFGLLLAAHGALAIQRLDAIVAVLLVLVVRAAERRDDRGLGFWAGLVCAAKIVPVVAAAAVVVAGTGDLRKRLKDLAIGFGLGLGLGLGPQLLLAPESIPMILRYHGARGLHVESTLGVLYGALKAIVGAHEAGILDYGSFNFHGPVADALAKVSPLLLLVLVSLVCRAVHATNRFALAALGATLALWMGGKVFSPQYLTWALPLVIALPDRSWRRGAIGLGVVLVLSQIYYRGYYDHVYRQLPLGIATMVVRLGVLGAGFAWVLVRARRADRGLPA